ncbi:MAG: DUF4430 domain-containing protein [Actinomycetota bacterium]
MRHASLAALALVLLLSGCGRERTGSGEASLWITRDRGATLLLVETVPAGLTAMQALDKRADISKRYGGRYVQSIEGVEGDISKRRDWFWFLNGIDADRSAADYRLRPGDVEWWDFRSWSGVMREPVVVGAFPEPFLHGWDGNVREVAVRYAPGRRRGAQAIGRLLHASSVEPLATAAPEGANVFSVVGGLPRFTASLRESDSSAGSPVRFVFAGDVAGLARDPAKFRYRYQVP